ncbi:ABC transporter ATP-binding protein [Candidatus Bathyarchaeota archaeon]|nr:ABC transporter ATP-binding protein [Candidatus Bathyarchaeota archaeon]
MNVYESIRGSARIVDDVSFAIGRGQVFGLTGESASGKTTIGLSILRLLGNVQTESCDPQRQVSWNGATMSQRQITGGKILFNGLDLLSLSEEEMMQHRGRDISMIFQNSIAAMHPLMTIGYQVGEPKEAHDKLKWEKIREIVFSYLGRVELPEAKLRYYHDPHCFSGGEGQRIMIAMALICGPSLLIADEPTSSLDMTIQRQVLELIKALKREFGLSVLYISHDIGVVFEMSDHVGIMYAGRIVECGNARSVYQHPRHPYTIALRAAYPDIHGPRRRLKGLRGTPPMPFDRPRGCSFHPRCDYAKPQCREKRPRDVEVESGHVVACLRVNEI